MTTEEHDERDPRLQQPGELGQPAPYDDAVENLPGSQEDPRMPETEIDPEAPISSARGTIDEDSARRRQ